ncbi:hypothetical protein DID78_07100 [Candidatus Marinamargulisbacteria bacterium SCGC AG-343-D04]|nr:hypothetical protein DID78_07100 [Candidatus Marinamargulisbacteria bacterium SCGC AG-343-D04]
MLRLFTHRLPFVFKSICFAGLLVWGMYFCFYEITSLLGRHLLQVEGVDIDVADLVLRLDLSRVGLLVFALSVFFFFYVIDVVFFTRRLDEEIKESLSDRKLEGHFSHFYENRSFHDYVDSSSSLFSFYKSLDNLKTARIVLEVGTIRQLMNTSSEGFLLVSKDLVVTHINHIAEEQLGLIPGEIIGEAVSRQISNEKLLLSLDKAFEFDHRILDVDIEEHSLLVSIFPLKDKFGDVLRCLIVFKQKTSEEVSDKVVVEGDSGDNKKVDDL